jgi:DHA1 family inner membrane transport protein
MTIVINTRVNPRIFILAFASFAFGTQTYVFAGFLERLAADLSVSIGAAGQLASAFAIAYALAAPVLAGLAAPYDRKRVLTVALLVLFVLNVLAAHMPDFASLLAVRVLSGLASALVMPVAAAAAATLVPPDQRGRALAIVLGGLVLSFVLGIPLGSVIGDAFGWPATFTFTGLLALVAAVAVGAVLPPVPNADRAGLRVLAIAFERRVLTNLLFTMTAFAATFCVIAFVGPVVTAISGLEGKGIGLMQAVIGAGMIVGVVGGGAIADRAHSSRVIALAFVIMALTLAAYTGLMAAGDGTSGVPAMAGLVVAILLGAAALFTLSPIVQTRLVEAAPKTVTVVLALNASMIFLGQGLGTIVGGFTIESFGLAYVGLVGAVVAVLGFLFALTAPRNRPNHGPC